VTQCIRMADDVAPGIFFENFGAGDHARSAAGDARDRSFVGVLSGGAVRQGDAGQAGLVIVTPLGGAPFPVGVGRGKAEAAVVGPVFGGAVGEGAAGVNPDF
jgi:hypothetical protein